MYKVKTYNAISVKGLDCFPRNSYEVGGDIAHPDAVLLRSHKLQQTDLPETVQAIARAGAGVNNVPVLECTEKGVVVFNTPGANANAVKELVLTGLLLASRGIVEGIDYVNTLTDITDAQQMHKQVEQEKKRFKGSEIAGKTLGIVGLGAIGSLVADMALELGMDVVGFDPVLSIEAAWRLSSDVQKMENLPALFAKADFISIHVPAIPQTVGMISKEVLQAVKPGACLLNFARETIVDTSAVVAALNENKLRKYIADFPTPELLNRDDTILMPHIGASTIEAEDNCAVMAAKQLMDYLENGNIKNSVNFPAAQMDRSSGHRITFSNTNVPKVLGHVLSVLADKNINVVDALNKSRGDIAYNIIDVDSDVGEGLLVDIEAIEGVIKARIL